MVGNSNEQQRPVIAARSIGRSVIDMPSALKPSAQATLADYSEAGRPLGALSAYEERRKQLLSQLITSWTSSAEFQAYCESVRKRTLLMLARIDARWGQIPLFVLEDVRMTERIVAWRDSLSETPRTADEAIRVLRRLIRFGRDHGLIAMDPTAGIKELPRDVDRSDIFWTEEDIAAFVRAAESLGKPQVAGANRLIAGTGLGLQDIIALRWQDIGEFTITKPDHGPRLRERKKVVLPRLPQLTPLLDYLAGFPRREGVETVLVDERGNSWRRSTLKKWEKIIREAAGIEHVDEEGEERAAKDLTALRRTFAVRLMTISDLSDAEIGSLMNWKPRDVRTLRLLSSSDD